MRGRRTSVSFSYDTFQQRELTNPQAALEVRTFGLACIVDIRLALNMVELQWLQLLTRTLGVTS